MTVEETKLISESIKMLTQMVDALQVSAAQVTDLELSYKIRGIRELGRDVRGMLSTLECTEKRNVIKSIRKIS